MASMAENQYNFLGMIFICFLSLIFLVLVSFLKRRSKQTTRLHLPPSPPSLPFIGHLHYLRTVPFCKSLHNLSTRYGPLLYLRLGAKRCLVVSSLSMAAEIFKTHDLDFASRPSFAFAKELPLGNLGIFGSPYGNYWRFMKKLCMTEVLSDRQLERSRAVRHEEIVRLLKVVLELANKKEAVNMGTELMKLTNSIVSRLLLSIRCGEQGDEAEKITELVKESFEVGSKMCFGDVLGPFKRLAFWLYGRHAMDVTRRYDEIFERVLKQHEEGGKREAKDFVDVLLRVLKDDDAEVKITRDHIKGILLDLYGGGTGSTAEGIQWAIAEVISHPDIFKKIREEIKSVVGSTRLVEESDIPRLPYLRAVVKETLRLHTPVPVAPRECLKSCKIKGFDVPEKTMVAINLYAIMRDPELWDNPTDFRPERFLVSDKDKDNFEGTDQMELINFIPFGAGRKSCPGLMFALRIMHTTIAVMVQCFDFKVGGEGEAKINMQAGAGGLSLSMAHPVICLPVVHFNPFASET